MLLYRRKLAAAQITLFSVYFVLATKQLPRFQVISDTPAKRLVRTGGASSLVIFRFVKRGAGGSIDDIPPSGHS